MPFKSEAQRRFMHAKHPKIADRWEKHTPKGKKLPEKVNEALDNAIIKMSELLEDFPPTGGNTSHMTGGSTAQIAMMVPPDITTVVSEPGGYGTTEQEGPEFSELELRLANRFLELIGGAERARDVINKCEECNECLGLTDDDSEEGSIDNIAAMIPSSSDLPTARGTSMSTLYNPNAVAGPFVQ